MDGLRAADWQRVREEAAWGAAFAQAYFDKRILLGEDKAAEAARGWANEVAEAVENSRPETYPERFAREQREREESGE